MAGPHFTGQFGLEPHEKQVNAMLQLKEQLPGGCGKNVNRFIKLFLKQCGWKVVDFHYKKTHLAFTMKPWPLHVQEADRLRSEDFRQEARRRRAERLSGQEGTRTPEP